MVPKRSLKIKHPDWLIILVYSILVIFGWMNIYATQSNADIIFDFSRKHGAQILWIIISFISAAVVMIISGQFYSVFSYYIYAFVILLLILVLGIGLEINGSKSWLSLGSFRFQPAELAKMATSLVLARYISRYDFKLNTLKNWASILSLISIPVILILLQKDWGSAVVFTSFLLMLYREGMSGWILVLGGFMIALFIASLLIPPVWVLWILLLITALLFFFITQDYKKIFITSLLTVVPLALILKYIIIPEEIENQKLYNIVWILSVILIVFGSFYYYLKKIKYIFYIFLFFISSVFLSYSVDYIFDNVLKAHHRDRIEDMLGIKEDRQGAGYNVYQSKVAIGSGGFWGKGYREGTQTNLDFVPEQSTDFIFCTIGEEWGFIGCSVTIFLYLFLLIRLIQLAERQKDRFSRIYGYCVASILFFHFAINIAMTIGLAPVIGIPLPFVSAGGSSLWSFTLLLFIFLKLDAIRYSPD